MFTIEIAGKTVRIENRYKYCSKLCEDFKVSDDTEADYTVSVSEEEILAEKSNSNEDYHNAVYESTCVHRKIVNLLIKDGIFIMHSAVVVVDGEAFAFAAKSGVGKSTHIRMWLETFGERAFVLNGDKPMYSERDGKFYVHGTPWKGKEGWGRNMTVPLSAVCLLGRGEKNEICRADTSEILSKLFHQVLLPSNKEDQINNMMLIDKFVKTVPFYSLKCNISHEAAEMSYNAMRTKTEDL